MADTEFKKLLAKVSLDTGDFPQSVKKLKAILDDLYQQEKKKVAEQKRALDDHVASVKKSAQQMKETSDQQLTASKKQLQTLQQSRQAYADITQASIKLKAQTDLEAISTGTVLKKRQDIVAQCEIEMERVSRLRNPLMEQSRILSQITAERQKQLALVEKQQIEAARRVPLYGSNKTQLGVTAPQAIQTEAQEAALALRLRMNQAEVLSNTEILNGRRKIVALADRDIAALTKKTVLTKEERSQLMSLLTLREQQTRVINSQVLAQERAAAKQVVPPQVQQVARLKAQLATLEVGQTTKARALHGEILGILDKQIAAIQMKVNLDREDVVTLGRLTAARQRESAAMSAGGGGGAGGVESGFFGKLQRSLVGGLGFAGIGGPVFTGVLAAEFVGQSIRSMATETVGMIQNIGQLEHLRDTYEKLGQIKGTDTTKFLGQMREATHDLVGDIPLLRLVNAAWQSDMKVTNDQIVELTHDVVALARGHAHSAEEAMQSLQMAFIER